MPSTYEPIATTTLGSAQATVTFSSIPQTYTDLVLITNTKNSSGSSVSITPRIGNGTVDSGSNYSVTFLYGTGSAAASERYSNQTWGYIARTNSTEAGNGITHFMNYSNTTTNKTFISRGNDAGALTIALVNLWRSTSAINIITLSSAENGVNFAAGSTFTLYGIKAA
jgi:hypothetical protein